MAVILGKENNLQVKRESCSKTTGHHGHLHVSFSVIGIDKPLRRKPRKNIPFAEPSASHKATLV